MFGFLGKVFRHEYSIKKHIMVIVVAVVMTVLFTITDNVLTPLIYGFTANTATAYFVASLSTLIPQIVCTFATVLIIFPGLLRLLKE